MRRCRVVQRTKVPNLVFRKDDVGDDVGAAVVPGVVSVPDGLAGGLLAGVNPVAGPYACMFGVASAANALAVDMRTRRSVMFDVDDLEGALAELDRLHAEDNADDE